MMRLDGWGARGVCALGAFCVLGMSAAASAAPPTITSSPVSRLDPPAGSGVGFGEHIAAYGGWIVVGAHRAQLPGDFDGVAYLYYRDQGGPNAFGLVRTLQADVTTGQTESEQFGWSVAIGPDLLAIGDNLGAAYLYGRDVGGWDQWGLLRSIPLAQPEVMAIDGGRLALVTINGDVQIYERDQGGPGQWGLATTFSDLSGERPTSVALDGDMLAVGYAGWAQHGGVRLRRKDQGGPGQWGIVASTQGATLGATNTASNTAACGQVALRGDVLALGCPGDEQSGVPDAGAVFVLVAGQGGADMWGAAQVIRQMGTPAAARLGASVRVDDEGNLYIGQPDASPSLKVYARQGATWSPGQVLAALGPADTFGASQATDGAPWTLIGAPARSPRGAVYLFGTDAPPEAVPLRVRVDEDDAVSGVVRGSSPTPITGYTLVQDAQHGALSFDTATGAYTYAPDADFEGEDTFTFTVTTATGTSASATATITVVPVNDPPVAQAYVGQVDEDTALTGQLAATDGDAGEVLTFAITQLPTSGTVSITSADRGEFLYTPTPNFAGTDSFMFTVTDRGGATSTATATITVAPINDAPMALPMSVGTPLNTPVTGRVSATDLDGDPLQFSVSTQANHGTAEITNPLSGLFRYTPAPNYTGADAFAVTVEDGKGGSATVTITVRVSQGNTLLAVDDAVEVDEDGEGAFDVLANDILPNSTLTANVTQQPRQGTARFEQDGLLHYTPKADFSGQDTLMYSVRDGDGLMSAATVTIQVRPIDDPPVFVAPTPADGAIVEIPEGRAYTLKLVAQDPDTTLLGFAVDPLPPGATFDATTRELRWTPTFEQRGDYPATLLVGDGRSTDERQVTLRVVDRDEDGDGLPDGWEAMMGLSGSAADSDGDTIPDAVEIGYDPTSGDPLPERLIDSDGDGQPDALDRDSDADGVSDEIEAGDRDLSTPPADTDGDGRPDYLQRDSDGDSFPDGRDNCRTTPNPDQADTDGDGVGDACTDDRDGDGVKDDVDSCPSVFNFDQADADGDGIGDACDNDRDGDGALNDEDNCPDLPNPDQIDADGNGRGLACDLNEGAAPVAAADDSCAAAPTRAPAPAAPLLVLVVGLAGVARCRRR